MKNSLIMTGTIALILSACTTNPYTGERQASNTGKGAAIGATVGAVIGALTGKEADNRRKRALIGAGIGALGGATVGSYMDKQEGKLREQLANSGVSVTRLGDDLVLNMPGNITFGIDRTELRDEFLPVLDSVVLVLKEYNKTLIDVTGHTDSTGTRTHNMDLSVRRSTSVANYLRGGGVNPNRIHALGVGPDHPVADNTTAEGRQLNRRVELVLKPLIKEGEEN